MKIYVASSWRNDQQPAAVVAALREQGHEVYDFKNPPGSTGFAWSEIDPNWEKWTTEDWAKGLKHPRAVQGFESDFNAMKWADACVMVMPCGRSAHLECGYFVGAKKPTFILMSASEPELMYSMADHLCHSLEELLRLTSPSIDRQALFDVVYSITDRTDVRRLGGVNLAASITQAIGSELNGRRLEI